MWQYTTETIINSNKGNLVGYNNARVRACAYTNAGVAINGKATANTDQIVIDGVGSFLVKYIKNVVKNEYMDEVREKATLTIPDSAIPTTDGILRLTIVLREEGSVRSNMQNAYLHKSKPFHYEIAVKSDDTTTTIAEKFVKLINKDMSLTDFDYFKVTSSTNVITFEADDCYIRFKEIQLASVSTAPAGSGEKLLGFKDYTSLAEGKVTLKGTEGCGTVTRLIKNLRMPTNATINPFAADNGGRPIPGGKYDQYLIEYETPRHHVAGGVMGSVGEVSRTSHILFLEKTGAADIATIIENIPNVTLDTVVKDELTESKQEIGSIE